MQEIKEKVLEMISKYEEQLTAKGIKIIVFKKYTETEVSERYGNHTSPGGAIFNSIDRAIDRNTEIKNGYHFEKNKYHSIILSVIPLDKKSVKTTECREYAFILKKVERAHIGLEPRRKTYQENQLLAKIEKRILKILKKNNKKTAQQICQNTFWDACRYAHSAKYAYKNKFCDKERDTWDIIFIILAVAVVITFFTTVWTITKLI